MLINQDPAKIFDELSILNVKLSKSEGELKSKNIDNFTSLADQIINQIGKLKYDEILSSEEYHNLYQENLEIFILVDKLNSYTNEKSMLSYKELADIGLEINSRNYNRYKHKKNLQEKFFNNTGISEIKLGYQ